MAFTTYLNVAFAAYLAVLVTHLQTLISSPPTSVPFSLATVLLPVPLWLYRVLSPSARTTWRYDLLLTLICADLTLSPLDWHSRLQPQLDPALSKLRHLASYWAIWLGAIWALTLEYKRSKAGSPMGDGDAMDPSSINPDGSRVTTELSDESKDTLMAPRIPPLLIPARTTHSRLIPKRHAFAYSYLLVGIPVGWTGRAGLALSADTDTLLPNERKRGYFNVRAADYLSRGGRADRGLEAKLREYLRMEGVEDKEWGWAYLVTAPRFLGYAFNPVSFWYVYARDAKDGTKGGLRCMVLEVNNTFGERRMYLLKPETDDEQKDAEKHGKRFTDSWTKDFHVSPFNSTKGTYSLSAKDLLDFKALGGDEADDVLQLAVDNNITLTSSDGETKLVARVFSEGDAIDPARLTSLGLVIVLLSWFWVGFATFPRIIYEAGRLFFRKKLHVWFRPEVLPSSLAREATKDERTLEVSFRRWLRSIVAGSQTPIKLVYTPPGDLGDAYTWTSGQADDSRRNSRVHKGAATTIEVNVLSPYFYSRFVHYVHAGEAFRTEGMCAEEKNRTVAVERADLLDMLIKAQTKAGGDDRSVLQAMGGLEAWRWRALRLLRCAPPAVAYPEEARESVANDDANAQVKVTDIRPQRLSDLDRFVAGEHGRQVAASNYRRIVCRAFLAQRLTFGVAGLLSLLDWMVRAAMVVGAFVLSSRLGAVEPGRLGEVQVAVGVVVSGVGLCVVHAWDLLVKG